MKQRFKTFGVVPMTCSECGRPFFILEWQQRPTFKTEGIIFLVSQADQETISRANMSDSLTCAIHRLYEGGSK
jgi:hypothetical protein